MKIFHYCSSKCTKAAKKRLNPRRLRHSKHYRRANNKELTVDASLEFEKVRNKPVKYDRELYSNTLSAMKTIRQIQDARKASFFDERMKKPQKMRKLEVESTIKRDMHKILAPIVAKRIAEKTLNQTLSGKEIHEKIQENPMLVLNGIAEKEISKARAEEKLRKSSGKKYIQMDTDSD